MPPYTNTVPSTHTRISGIEYIYTYMGQVCVYMMHWKLFVQTYRNK